MNNAEINTETMTALMTKRDSGVDITDNEVQLINSNPIPIGKDIADEDFILITE
jgi:hypothetical protein